MRKIVLSSALILFVVLITLGYNPRVTNLPSESATVTVTAQPLFPEPQILFTAAIVLLGVALFLVPRVWRKWLCTFSTIPRWRWLHFCYQVFPVAAATLFSALAAIFICPIMIGFSGGHWAGILYNHARWMVFIGLCILTIGLILHGILALCSVIRTKTKKETEYPDGE